MPSPPVAPLSRPSLRDRLGTWLNGGAQTAAGQPTQRALPQIEDFDLAQVVARHERSTVYRAIDRSTGQIVALKTVQLGDSDPASRQVWKERFLREAEAAGRLRHPDIVSLLAGGVQGTDESFVGWLAMEWVPGTDLARYTAPSRLLPEALVLTLAARIALALAHAHQAGVMHRDVKPGNLLFDAAHGVVKVTDFGSARLTDALVTRSGMIVGTPAYMAPEQLAGAEATPQSDLYSLGVVLFELIAGRRPFHASSMGELLGRIAHAPVPPLAPDRPGLPELVDDILRKLLDKAPERRHADGRQLALELRMAIAHYPPPAPPRPAQESGAQS